jgi:hypothetical protein
MAYKQVCDRCGNESLHGGGGSISAGHFTNRFLINARIKDENFRRDYFDLCSVCYSQLAEMVTKWFQGVK